MSTMAETAFAYAQHGRHVHPLRGKIPLLPDWPRRASSDPATVAEYWRDYPDANIGNVPGKDGDIVFDIDSDDARAEARSLGLLDVHTLHIATPRPGLHVRFRRGSADELKPMKIRHHLKVANKLPGMEVKC